MNTGYEIKNWAEFQQYKDDRPLHWIKLHTKLLNDFRFNQLPEITQLHLVKLWLLAADQHGVLEGGEEWLAKLINTKKLAVDVLVREGFLISTEPYKTVPREEKRREEEIGGVCTGKKPTPIKKIIEKWDIFAAEHNLPPVAKSTPTLEEQIRVRYRDDIQELDHWDNFFASISQSKFLTGRTTPTNGRTKPFRASLVWVTKLENFAKIAAGEYQ